VTSTRESLPGMNKGCLKLPWDLTLCACQRIWTRARSFAVASLATSQKRRVVAVTGRE